MANLTPARLAEIRGRVAAFIPRSWITDDIAALLAHAKAQAAEIERLRKQLDAHKKNERARWGNAREVLGLDKEEA